MLRAMAGSLAAVSILESGSAVLTDSPSSLCCVSHFVALLDFIAGANRSAGKSLREKAFRAEFLPASF